MVADFVCDAVKGCDCFSSDFFRGFLSLKENIKLSIF